MVIGIVAVVMSRPPVDMAQVTQASDTTESASEETPEPAADQAVDAPATVPAEPSAPAAPQAAPAAAVSPGRYEQYNASLVDDAGYSTTILFFYAAWCPECRAYDQAINAGDLPDGVQILRVTYDDAQDLRQKYGVTIQSTFVRVNSAGEKQVLWNGYGKDKSVTTILENTK